VAAVGVAAVIPLLAAAAVYVQHAGDGPHARHASYTRAPSAPSICAAPSQPALASRLSGDLVDVLHRRSSTVALAVTDGRAGLTCRLGAAWQFDSAGLVRLTILAAQLRRNMEEHRYLSQDELNLTSAMTTASDDSATSALWQDLGRRGLQHFLNLAGMTQTVLGPGGYWGLTRITAQDEMTLLNVLTAGNSVLDSTSRQYALSLMAGVAPWQHWGVPAGAPGSVVVNVQDGWMRRSGGWRVHSAGAFAGRGSTYLIVVLTQGNPTMAYGVRTIEDAAEVVHRDLNPGAAGAVPPTPPSVLLPSQQEPGGPLPPNAGRP
jgi:hypothetical protein